MSPRPAHATHLVVRTRRLRRYPSPGRGSSPEIRDSADQRSDDPTAIVDGRPIARTRLLPLDHFPPSIAAIVAKLDDGDVAIAIDGAAVHVVQRGESWPPGRFPAAAPELGELSDDVPLEVRRRAPNALLERHDVVIPTERRRR